MEEEFGALLNRIVDVMEDFHDGEITTNDAIVFITNILVDEGWLAIGGEK